MISRSPYGEWACPKAECFPEEYGPGANPRYVSFPFVSTMFFYHTLLQMQEMADILNKPDGSYLALLTETIKSKINQKYFNAGTAQYDQGTQSANAMAVMMGLAEEKDIPRIVENIVENLKAHDYHLTTGSVGTKAVIQVLCENGYEDVAYKVMTATTSPSFGYMIVNGATTMWERWEADHDNNIMNSRNHPMLAQACVWFYKYLGGVRVDYDRQGIQKVCVCPLIPEGLNQVKVSVDVMAGKVTSEWEKKDDAVVLTIEVPQNVETEAKILKKYGRVCESLCLTRAEEPVLSEREDSMVCQLGAGRYQFIIRK